MCLQAKSVVCFESQFLLNFSYNLLPLILRVFLPLLPLTFSDQKHENNVGREDWWVE